MTMPERVSKEKDEATRVGPGRSTRSIRPLRRDRTGQAPNTCKQPSESYVSIPMYKRVQQAIQKSISQQNPIGLLPFAIVYLKSAFPTRANPSYKSPSVRVTDQKLQEVKATKGKTCSRYQRACRARSNAVGRDHALEIRSYGAVRVAGRRMAGFDIRMSRCSQDGKMPSWRGSCPRND